MNKGVSHSVICRLRRTAGALLGRLRSTGSPGASKGIEATVTPAAQDKPAVRDTFCVLAWNHLQIAPNGTVKMCCIAEEDVQEKGRTMSLYTDTYEEIWNSGYMRDARRGMAEGEKISPCMRCYQEEDSVGQSRRTIQNGDLARQDRTNTRGLYPRSSWQFLGVRDRPGFLQLNLGNLCNLACRMCSSQYSSRIESDSVHNKWMPAAYPDVARWRGKRLVFGPRQFFGVNYQGFYDYECSGDYALRWSNGSGVISFEVPPGTQISRLGLSLRAVCSPSAVVIRLNGQEIFSGYIGPEWKQEFESPALANHATLEIGD